MGWDTSWELAQEQKVAVASQIQSKFCLREMASHGLGRPGEAFTVNDTTHRELGFKYTDMRHWSPFSWNLLPLYTKTLDAPCVTWVFDAFGKTLGIWSFCCFLQKPSL